VLIVGLTGGIASGKSLVSRVFRDLGAHVIDADRIVHELLRSDQEACKEVARHFGPSVVQPDGCIDRRRLGAIVFQNGAERTWLNSCLHPKVFEVFTMQTRHIQEQDPQALVVFDAALLVETGFHRGLDRIVVVYAEPEQQRDRLMARDRFTEAEALQRIASQMPLAQKRGHADYVITNTGTRERTERQAREVFRKLKAEAERS
jgi:dephospho-CoA kinase